MGRLGSVGASWVVYGSGLELVPAIAIAAAVSVILIRVHGRRVSTLGLMPHTTRKLYYRKDDRAMRPIHGALKIFGTTPTATIPHIFHGLLF